MQVYTSLDQVPLEAKPVVLTLGNFDGIHKGHQIILNKVKELSSAQQLLSAVITFRNHPSTVLRPNHPTLLLTTPEHKLKLLEGLGLDIVIMLEFTKELATQTAEQFLRRVMEVLSFRVLILGYDHKFGKDRLGDRETLIDLSKDMHFFIEPQDPLTLGEKPISSTLIRKNIQEDDLAAAKEMLGRSYSIYAPITKGQGLGKKMGFPTANIEVSSLCLPSFGVYAVTIKLKEKSFNGIANIGFAPTVRSDHKPILEVFLFDQNEDLYNQYAEVIFQEFIRPEKQFASLEELQKQIQQDVAAAKEFFKK